MTLTHDKMEKKISELNRRVTASEKRMNQIVDHFGEFMDMLAMWNNAYYGKDNDKMYELAIRTEKLLDRMREYYG